MGDDYLHSVGEHTWQSEDYTHSLLASLYSRWGRRGWARWVWWTDVATTSVESGNSWTVCFYFIHNWRQYIT